MDVSGALADEEGYTILLVGLVGAEVGHVGGLGLLLHDGQLLDALVFGAGEGRESVGGLADVDVGEGFGELAGVVLDEGGIGGLSLEALGDQTDDHRRETVKVFLVARLEGEQGVELLGRRRRPSLSLSLSLGGGRRRRSGTEESLGVGEIRLELSLFGTASSFSGIVVLAVLFLLGRCGVPVALRDEMGDDDDDDDESRLTAGAALASSSSSHFLGALIAVDAAVERVAMSVVERDQARIAVEDDIERDVPQSSSMFSCRRGISIQ